MVGEFLYNNILAEQLASEGKIKQFGLFILLKARYNSGVYKDWSIKSMSEKTGFSRQLLTKSIKMFLECGWVRVDGKNLVFKKFKEIDNNKEKSLTTIKIDQGDGVKSIVSKLRFAIIKSRNDKFQFLKRVNTDYHSPRNWAAHKRALKLVKQLDLKKLPNAGQNYTISIAKIAKLFGCSSASACKEMQGFKKSGDVLCVSGFSKAFVSGKTARAALAAVPGTFFMNGVVYIVSCNQYIF